MMRPVATVRTGVGARWPPGIAVEELSDRTADGHRTYRERDMEWLDVCIKLRSSGMPLAAIRRYAELVREGPGNEKERLDILRQHQQRVTAQIVALTTCLQLINYKVNLYQDSLTADPSDPVWSDIQDCLAYDK